MNVMVLYHSKLEVSHVKLFPNWKVTDMSRQERGCFCSGQSMKVKSEGCTRVDAWLLKLVAIRLQGMAVMLSREGLSSESVYNAFTRVLEDGSYRAAAARMSKRIRSRKRTPLQETAGELSIPVDMLDLITMTAFIVIRKTIIFALNFIRA